MNKVAFLADKVQLKTNLAGGNSTVTLHTGEYSLEDISKLIMIPQETAIKITVEWE